MKSEKYNTDAERPEFTHVGVALGVIPVYVGEYKGEGAMEARYGWCKPLLDVVCFFCGIFHVGCPVKITGKKK